MHFFRPCTCRLIGFLLLAAVFFILPGAVRPARASTATTSVTVLLVCGDGVKDASEACDGTDFGGLACHDYGFNEGELTCSADCNTITTGFCSTCGNSVREGYEQCDASDFGGNSCSTFGYNTGTLSCSGGCNVVLTACASVGVTEPGSAGSQGGGSGSRGGGGPVGFNPGSELAPKETKVIIIGKAYPGSDVNVLIDGKVIGIVKADPKADFYFETKAITPGVVGIGIWAEDSYGRKSALQTLTFRVASGAVTTVSGAYLSPSIDIDKPTVAKGETLKIFGQTVPESDVMVHVNSEAEIIKQTDATAKGDWNLDFDTTPLADEEYHIAKASFQLKAKDNIIQSGFSKSMSFYVGKSGKAEVCPNADLNKDKKVNLVDFSILLFYWGTDNACADQNHNKKVDLIDFSIMLYYWTG